MPTIRHPETGATAEIPDRVVPFWTGPGGWDLADAAAPARPRRRQRAKAPSRPRSRAPKSTPAPDAGAPDDVPGQGSSTTTHHEE